MLSENNGISTWQPTVSENPWLFGGKLVPIYELFPDGEKKKSMKIAVQVYSLMKFDFVWQYDIENIYFF